MPASVAGVAAIAAGAQHAVVLVIPTASTITLSPMSQTVNDWQSASFTVKATGYPLQYQWRRDGIDIGGAIGPTYNLGPGQTSQAAGYTVVVGNSAGSVTSAPPAVLTVIPAIELFKPFIYHRLEQRGHCTTIKQAKELVEQQDPVVWDILEEVIKDHPILLNRAPTLHRLGIQAFEPVLVEGKAIKIHPLVCTAFNADFDGDQMAVHIPLSPEAQIEASTLMLSSNNILSPAHGSPIAVPTQDMVLGCYYLTKARPGAKGEGRTFASTDDVLIALEMGEVETLTPIKLRHTGRVIDLVHAFDNQNILHTEPIEFNKQYMETTVGRVILNDNLPRDMPFINGLLKKKGLGQLVQYCYLKFGLQVTVHMLDEVKALGFLYATRAGISIGIDDMVVPAEKAGLVREAEKEVVAVESQYQDGAITHGERYNKIIEIWSKVTERVSDEMMAAMEEDDRTGRYLNPIYIMADSGARGSKQQIRQLSGMRGLMAKPSGEIIETPITANFREGLNVLQYFISTHGARKGLADTALKTADSGYLTRRLVDVAQDVIVSENDCGTGEGIYVEPIIESGEIIEPLRDRIVGRVALEDQKDYEGNVIVGVNQEITEDLAAAIQAAGIERVKIRSVLTCESKRGVCVMCYGRNLATGRLVERGEAVGVIAAQSIGEPGTPVTMRTFHIGGTASRSTEQSTQDAKSDGFARYIGIQTVRSKARRGEGEGVLLVPPLPNGGGLRRLSARSELSRSWVRGQPLRASELIPPEPTVHRDHGPRDVARERRAQEHHHHRQLLRFPIAADRNLRAREAVALLRRIVAADLLAHDAAGRDRVDGDAESTYVAREPLGPGVDRGLGGEGRVDVLGLGFAGDGDDAAPLPLHHAWQDRMGELAHAREIERHRLFPAVLAGVDGKRPAAAGAVDEDLHFAERAHGLIADALGRVRRHHVLHDERRRRVLRPGDLGRELIQQRLAPRHRRDLGTFTSEHPRDGAPDPHAGAGDERGASLELQIHGRRLSHTLILSVNLKFRARLV